MRAYEFILGQGLQQAQSNSLKQQARRLQIQQKQQRLRKQREKVADTTAQLAKLQNKSI
jgi:hypothetical protein